MPVFKSKSAAKASSGAPGSGPSVDTTLAMNISVGIAQFTSKSNFVINFHFQLECGGDWVVQIDYGRLKILDALLAANNKKLSTVPFPIIDKHLFNVFQDSCRLASSTYTVAQQMIISSTVTERIQLWVQMVLSRFHSYSPEIKLLLNRMFSINPKIKVLSEIEKPNDVKEATDAKTASKDTGEKESSSSHSGFLSIFSKDKKEKLSKSTVESISGGRSKVEESDASSTSSNNKHSTSSNTSATSKYSATPSREGTVKSSTATNKPMDVEDNVMSEKPPLCITVRRGSEGRQNRVEYEITLQYDIKSFPRTKNVIPLTVLHRYNDFKLLCKQLQDFNVTSIDRIHRCPPEALNKTIFLLAKFPLPPISLFNKFGSSLNEQELAIRTRCLDLWLREICSNYHLMSRRAKEAIKKFLQLAPKGEDRDAAFLDLLSKGMIEGSRSEVPIMNTRPVLSHNHQAVHLHGKSAHQPSKADSKDRAPMTKNSPKSKSGISSGSSAVSRYDNCSEYDDNAAADEDEEEEECESNYDKYMNSLACNAFADFHRSSQASEINLATVKLMIFNSVRPWIFPYFSASEAQNSRSTEGIWGRLSELLFSSTKKKALESQAQILSNYTPSEAGPSRHFLSRLPMEPLEAILEGEGSMSMKEDDFEERAIDDGPGASKQKNTADAFMNIGM